MGWPFINREQIRKDRETLESNQVRRKRILNPKYETLNWKKDMEELNKMSKEEKKIKKRIKHKYWY